MTILAFLLALQTAATPLTVESLVGLDEAAARRQLGEPDIARREAKGALWTYRRQGCVLLVYLAEKPGEGLRVTGASSGQRRAGDTPIPVETCLARPRG